MLVDLLILGAGWTSTFLIPLCQEKNISFAATTRSGRDNTILFDFDPESHDHGPFEALPDAKTVLITFPVTTRGASERLVRGYLATRRRTGRDRVGFIQLGSSGIWDTKDNLGSSDPWRDRHSEHNKDARAICEDELLALSPEIPTTVLNLAGLWGGQRSVRRFVVNGGPKTKENLRIKGGVHFIHGTDVAQAIVAVHDSFSLADSSGQRWIVTDGRVYDWWDLVYAWGNRVTTKSENELSLTSIRHRGDGNLTVGPRPEWVTELMLEHDVRALPRGADLLRRALDSREFWRVFGMVPMKPLLDG